jgi:hypothetical protein
MHDILAATTDINTDRHTTPLTNTHYQSPPLTIQPAVTNPLPPREAEAVAKAYLIDAAMSLAEGRGPLVVSAL